MGRLKERLADFAVRRLVQARGSGIIYAGRRQQAEIGMPEAYGLSGFEERFIAGGGGARIGLWYKPPANADKPVYVVFHGRTGHWGFAGDYPPPKKLDGNFKDNTYRTKWLKALAKDGAGVVAVHTRGFGLSNHPSCKKTDARLIEADMRAVSRFLETERIPSRQVVAAGESLGGALAALLAETMAEQGREPAMLALVNSFSDMARMVHEQARSLRGLKGATEENVRRAMGDPLNTESRLQRLPRTTKLYIAHSVGDEVIGGEHARRLRESAEKAALDTTFRFLAGDYKTRYIRNHTNWDPDRLAADMEQVFYGRGVAEPVGPGR